MSLHMSDKKLGGTRDNPTVNHHDLLTTPQSTTARPAHGTLSVNYVSGNQPTAKSNSLQSGIGQVIKTDTVTAFCAGASNTSITSVPHNLGFAPYAVASLNNAVITGFLSPVSLLLPTWVSASVSGGNISFSAYMSIMVDDLFLYIFIINATGADVSHAVTYYLYRQPINVSYA